MTLRNFTEYPGRLQRKLKKNVLTYAHALSSRSTASYKTVREQRIAKQGFTRIDIVVCVHNALEDVTNCLEAIKTHRTSSNQKLIIVDDGSDKPTAAYLEKFSEAHDWVSRIRHYKAVGYTKAANAGLKASSGELVILLNSDTVVTDSWAEKMADAIEATAAGIVGPLSNAASVQSIPDFRSKNNQTAINELPAGVNPEKMNTYCEEWTPARKLPIVPLVHGFCFGVTREVLNKVGLFDEKNFPKGYGEENDYCLRAADQGFSLVIATHTYIYHEKSKSYDDTKRITLMREGQLTLRKLYGKGRVEKAIRKMVENPQLIHMRNMAKKLYLGR